jgi:hypothetical protein
VLPSGRVNPKGNNILDAQGGLARKWGVFLRQYMGFVMKRMLRFVTGQQLLVPGLTALVFALYQAWTGGWHFHSIEEACRSVWPYMGVGTIIWIVVCFQASGDLNQLLREEQAKSPSIFLPSNQPRPPHKVTWPGPIMATLCSLPVLAIMTFATYESLCWVQPWRLPARAPQYLDMAPTDSPTPLKSPQVQRSYLEYEGNPVFGGSSPTGTEGSAFTVGDPLGFNVHYRAAGPNEVKSLRQSFATIVTTRLFSSGNGYEQKVIDGAVDEFFAEFKKETRANKAPVKPHTLLPGDREFNTAYGWTDNYTKHRIVTQGDLDAVKIGSQTWIVISILTYLDGNTIHHLRRCEWLSPPATPQSVWHFCGGKFPDSD